MCANPANPTYNHYMFETIGALMRNVCVGPQRAETVLQFETMLFPPFQVSRGGVGEVQVGRENSLS